MNSKKFVNFIGLSALLATGASASSKRQASDLLDSYDFIIAGGGTSGLTVADRLSEYLPSKTVLVIEYGGEEYAPGTFDPPVTVWGSSSKTSYFSFTSLPNPEVKNATALTLGGKLVGGSSGINGMFFDRPSRFDWDAFAEVGSPEFDKAKERWDWDAVFPYYKKSVTFTEPTDKRFENLSYTWDMSAYGGKTPIFSSFPPFLWGDHDVAREAWKDLGIAVRKECAGGDKDGLCWIPISEHPQTSLRSHSGLGHWAAVNETRKNYDLLVKHQVVRVIYPAGLKSGPPVVEVRPVAGGEAFNVTAKAEVILSAGVMHTPTILQRSGIGPKAFLEAAKIPVLVDLPGVGSNLQDHSGPKYTWDYKKPGTWSPLPQDMVTSQGFVDEATRQFQERPARGPYTLAMSNSALYLSLPNMSTTYMEIINKINDMVDDGSASSYLPEIHRSDPRMISGYKHQLTVLANFFANPKAPSFETAFATGTSLSAIHLHPLSRGTVRLDLKQPLEIPIIDYRAGSNPVDFDIHIAHVRYLRRLNSTDTMLKYGAFETPPLQSVQDDYASLLKYVKDTMVFSYMHPCCTAAMMPEEKGGVVGPDLKVHGVEGLRVVDMSVLPLLPSSHLSSTAYAVGEKAADIISRDWSGKTS